MRASQILESHCSSTFTVTTTNSIEATFQKVQTFDKDNEPEEGGGPRFACASGEFVGEFVSMPSAGEAIGPILESQCPGTFTKHSHERGQISEYAHLRQERLQARAHTACQEFSNISALVQLLYFKP